MAFDALTTTEIASGKPLTNSIMTKIKESLDFLNGQIGSLGAIDIPNGSFEVDSDLDGTPDNWTLTAFSGGTITRTTTAGEVSHGSAAVKMVHPGGASNGGGYAVSDYVPCSPARSEMIGLIHSTTAAGMHNQVKINYYTNALVSVSTETIYDSINNPTTTSLLMLGLTIPATARFYTVELVGGFTDTDVSGTTYFDFVSRLSIGRSQFVTYEPYEEGTISEQTETSVDTWTDNGTFVLSLPIRGLPTTVSFSAELKSSDPAATQGQRFYVGSNFTNEETTTSLTYVTNTFTFSFSAAETSGNDLTVTMQLYNDVTTQTAYGRKTTTDAAINYDYASE